MNLVCSSLVGPQIHRREYSIRNWTTTVDVWSKAATGGTKGDSTQHKTVAAKTGECNTITFSVQTTRSQVAAQTATDRDFKWWPKTAVQNNITVGDKLRFRKATGSTAWANKTTARANATIHLARPSGKDKLCTCKCTARVEGVSRAR